MDRIEKTLDGLKVVELTTYVAAPTCGRLLADLGADVIKVESPRGDAWRYSFGSDEENPRFHVANSGKRGIVLNLKTDDGMTAMMRLISEADVFITNTRMPSLKRLGLDPSTIRTRFPKLIYACLTGYGEKGPEADFPGFDSVAFWAKSGYMADMSLATEDYYPATPPIGAGDTAAAQVLFSEILIALLQREKTDMGDYVSTSLYNVGIWTANGSITQVQKLPVRMPRRRDQCLPEATTYRCADDEWIHVCILEYDRHAPPFFKALGYPGILDNPRYATYEARRVHNKELLALAEKAFLSKTAAEWLEKLQLLDIVCCRVDHFGDVAHSAQAWANDYLEKVTYPSGKEYAIPCSPIRLESQGVNRLRPAPELGADTEQVLADLDLSSK